MWTRSGPLKADSEPEDPNLAKALLGKWQGAVGELLREVEPNLYVLPTSDEMFLLESEVYGRAGRVNLLARFLEQLSGTFEDIVIDCPPSLSPLNDAALVAARDRGEDAEITGKIVIPVEAEDSSIGALRLLLRQIATLQDALPGVQLTIAGLVVTMYDARRGRIATSTLNSFKQHALGVLGVINQRAALTEAGARQAPAIAHELAQQRAAELAARLQEVPTPDKDAK